MLCGKYLIYSMYRVLCLY